MIVLAVFVGFAGIGFHLNMCFGFVVFVGFDNCCIVVVDFGNPVVDIVGFGNILVDLDYSLGDFLQYCDDHCDGLDGLDLGLGDGFDCNCFPGDILDYIVVDNWPVVDKKFVVVVDIIVVVEVETHKLVEEGMSLNIVDIKAG